MTEHDCPICEGSRTVRMKYGKGRCSRCPSAFVQLDGELVPTQKATVKMSLGGKQPRRLPAPLARIAQSGRR